VFSFPRKGQKKFISLRVFHESAPLCKLDIELLICKDDTTPIPGLNYFQGLSGVPPEDCFLVYGGDEVQKRSAKTKCRERSGLAAFGASSGLTRRPLSVSNPPNRR
jgi:hypothetical protein